MSNFIEAIGAELLIAVINNHTKYTIIAIEIGCRYKFLKSSLSLNIFTQAIIIKPNNKGSVGKDISIPIGLYIPNSWRLVDKGVKKATKVNNKSTLKIAIEIIPMAKGINIPQYFSSAIK